MRQTSVDPMINAALRRRRNPRTAAPKLTPSEQVIQEYDDYLKKERVLSEATRRTYQPLALQFLKSRFGSGPVNLPRLRALDAINYVQQNAKAVE